MTSAGDISDGTFVHWLKVVPRLSQRRFAAVACGRTFDLATVAGRSSVSRFLILVTCPKCRAAASSS